MMTHTQSIARRVLQPIVLAIVMLFSTPVAGLLHGANHASAPVVTVANETVVFKSANTSVAYKS
jgi:hypothetical protein